MGLTTYVKKATDPLSYGVAVQKPLGCMLLTRMYVFSFPDRVYPAAIYRLLLQAKRLGDRSGAGFYKHANGKPSPDPELLPLLQQARAQGKIENQVIYYIQMH